MTTRNTKQWMWMIPVVALSGVAAVVGSAAGDKTGDPGMDGMAGCKMMGHGQGSGASSDAMSQMMHKRMLGAVATGTTPGAILGYGDDLKLTAEQTAKLRQIDKETQEQAKAVLSEQQRTDLAKLQASTGMGMMMQMPGGGMGMMTMMGDKCMMNMMDGDGKGKAMDCPMMGNMGGMKGGDAKADVAKPDAPKMDMKMDTPAGQAAPEEGHKGHH